MTTAARATFSFDLGSPFAYLTAERIDSVIRAPVRWQPVLLGGLFKLTGRSSWALGDAARREQGMADVERRALRYGLAPVRWPEPWPSAYLFAMRAATHAFAIGRGREFTHAAFADAFARGIDLAVPENVLAAGRRAGIDPAALAAATQDAGVKAALRSATDAAHALGVIGVPTIAVAQRLYWGDDRLEEAAAALAGDCGS